MKKENRNTYPRNVFNASVIGKRLVSLLLAVILILAILPMNVLGNSQQQMSNQQLQSMLQTGSYHLLFGQYTAFTTNYINNVSLLTVFTKGLSSDVRKAMVKGAFLGGDGAAIVNAVMNNQQNIDAIVSHLVVQMTGNVGTLRNDHVSAGFSASSAINDLIKLIPAGGNRRELEALGIFLDTADYSYNPLAAGFDAMWEGYADEIAILKSLKGLSLAPLWNSTMDNVINEYARSAVEAISSVGAHAAFDEGVDKVVELLLGAPTVSITTVLDAVNVFSRKTSSLDIIMVTNDLNLQAVKAFQTAAERIVNGDTSEAAIRNYRNAFNFARELQIVRYEAKRAGFSKKSSENSYIDAQLASLRHMSYDSFVYSISFASWAFEKPSAVTSTKYVVVDTPAIVRQSFYESSGEMRRLSPGTQVTVIETVVNRHGNRWYLIEIPGAPKGWVFSGKLSRVMTRTSNTQQKPTQTQQTIRPTPTPKPQQTELTVRNTVNGNWHITIPSNLTVNLFSSPTARSRTTYYSPGRAPKLAADRQVTLSNGTVRYRIDTPDRGLLYFELVSGMTVDDRNASSTHTSTQTSTPKATIQYNANGGRGAPSNHFVHLDNKGVASFSLSTTRATRSGYTFIGWRLYNDTAFDIDSPGQGIAIATGNATQSTTFTYFAQWQRTQQTAAPKPTPTVTDATFSNMRTFWEGGRFQVRFSFTTTGSATDAGFAFASQMGTGSFDQPVNVQNSSGSAGFILSRADALELWSPGVSYSWIPFVIVDGEEIVGQPQSFTFSLP